MVEKIFDAVIEMRLLRKKGEDVKEESGRSAKRGRRGPDPCGEGVCAAVGGRGGGSRQGFRCRREIPIL